MCKSDCFRFSMKIQIMLKMGLLLVPRVPAAQFLFSEILVSKVISLNQSSFSWIPNGSMFGSL